MHSPTVQATNAGHDVLVFKRYFDFNPRIRAAGEQNHDRQRKDRNDEQSRRRSLNRCAATSAVAVTVQGDEFPIGTQIDDEFVSSGVLFSSNLGHVIFAEDDFRGIFGTRRGFDWVGIPDIYFGAPIRLTFVLPSDPTRPGGVNGSISADFGDGGGDLDSLRLRAFDLNGQLIGTSVASAIAFGSISITGVGIHSVVFDPNPGAGGATNTALDFVRFDAVVPEPGTGYSWGSGSPCSPSGERCFEHCSSNPRPSCPFHLRA